MKRAGRSVAALAALAAAIGLGACGAGDDGTATIGRFELLPNAPAGYAQLAGDATLERSDEGTTVSLALSGLEPKTEYVAHVHSGTCTEADPGGPHFKFDAAGSDEPPNEIHLEFTATGDGEAEAEVSSDREVPVGGARSIVLHAAGDEHETGFGVAAGGAGSILVHEGHRHEGEAPSPPDKIACAELEGAADDAASAGAAGEAELDAGGVPTIVIRNGEPVAGIEELEYSAGDEIRFRVESDVTDEVHVHGYDVMKEVAAGGTVAFSIPAEIEGIFEVELEGRRQQIAELRVNP
jgi:Cu/Zn superoxide dismutase